MPSRTSNKLNRRSVEVEAARNNEAIIMAVAVIGEEEEVAAAVEEVVVVEVVEIRQDVSYAKQDTNFETL